MREREREREGGREGMLKTKIFHSLLLSCPMNR